MILTSRRSPLDRRRVHFSMPSLTVVVAHL